MQNIKTKPVENHGNIIHLARGDPHPRGATGAGRAGTTIDYQHCRRKWRRRRCLRFREWILCPNLARILTVLLLVGLLPVNTLK